MDKERWREISRIFNVALEKPGDDRFLYLKDACGDDAGLRGEIEMLLAASDEHDSFIDSQKIEVTARRSRTPLSAQ